MRATMVLSDAADAVNGKLYLMGGGWTHALSAGVPMTMALAVLIHVPWNETNQRHSISLRLLTHDGDPVEQEGNEVQAVGEFEVGRPPGIKAGSELNTPATFRFNGVVLDEGGYVWELRVGDEEIARTPFFVMQPPG